MTEMTLENVFFAALERAPTGRAAYLDEVCAGDADLRARIEKMLAAQSDLGDFLTLLPDPDATPQGSGAVRLFEAPVGTVIAGRYKLLQRIGKGGMGTVWMADQLEPVKRRVAVKLISNEHGRSREILARFEAERQAIALMDHPHIAKLLDAGTTPESETSPVGPGRPFFVMELVKGVALNEFCDQQQLSVPARLKLFVQICSAVQHAHQKGVIHRDLKPGNILVESHDGKPVPRVIDFGLAKATGGVQLTDNTLFTRLGTVAGTPLYMAPEQATFNALDIDTRADVYALGVILYELLTGTTPIEREQLKQTPFDEILRAIRESEPPTPSKRLSSTDSKPAVAVNRQTEPQKLGRFVRGDLDWIVMKALAKERDRRYESPNGFAGDIERFLNHEPVLAGPPSTAYRLRKFVRRNRPQALAGVLLVVALFAGIAGTTFGLIRAEHRRAEAEGARTNEAEQRGAAEVNAARAVAAALAEKAARAREAEERKKTEKEWDRAEGLLYGSRLELALNAWREKDTQLARRHLNDTPPERRGWEYDFIETLFKHRGQRAFLGHTGGVLSVAYSPDGKRIASAGYDKTVKVWDAATGKVVLTLNGHTDTVWCVAFSPDGKHLASSSTDKTVRVCEAATGKYVLTVEGHTEGVNSVTFSPDGKSLASGSSDNTVKLWEAATGKHILTLMGHENGVRGVCFSPDGKRLVSADSESVRVWDAGNGNLLHKLSGHTAGINSVCYSPDGKRLASASGNPLSYHGEVMLWDADTGKHVLTLDRDLHICVRSVCFSPDSKCLAIGNVDDTVRVCDATTGGEILTLVGHSEGTVAVQFSPDGKHLASGSFDKSVKVWDAVLGQDVLSFKYPARFSGMHLSPDGTRVVLGGTEAIFGPDGKHAGGVDQPVRVRDTGTGRELLALGDETIGDSCVAFSPDGTRIATGNSDKTVRVWNATTGRKLFNLRGHTERVNSVAFSHDGTRIVTSSQDGTAKVWEIPAADPKAGAENGKESFTLEGHKGPVRCVALSPDGTRIATGGQDKTARMWEAATGRELLNLKEHSCAVNSVAFSPDGERLAVAVGGSVGADFGRDGEVNVWDLKGQKLLTLKGHTDGVEGVAFSPDGKRIVTGSSDKTARVWNATTGQELLTLRGHGEVTFVCFSPGGVLATGCRDGKLKFWDAGKGPGGPLP